MSELKVADDEYTTLAEAYIDIASTAEDEIKEYFQCLSSICNNAIPSGLVYNNLSAYLSEAQKIQGVLRDICRELSENSSNYLEEIDSKDQYVY